MKGYSFSLLSTVLLLCLSGCAERNQTLNMPNIPAAHHIEDADIFVESSSKSQIFQGGTDAQDLDLAMIRLGEDNQTERLVLDSYKQNSATQTPSVKAKRSGKYKISYTPSQQRITATLHGYRALSALGNSGIKQFPSSRYIKEVTLLKHPAPQSYTVSIILKEDATVNIFELQDPARIVIDVKEASHLRR